MFQTRTFALGTTAIALILTGAAHAQPIEEVVVTGSHIRGVAPVGSTIVQVGQEDLKKSGAGSASDLLMKIPQFINLGNNEQTATGGTRVQGAAGNTTFSRSVNLRGIGGASTLTLFNGQRQTKNSLSDSSDIDMYPVPLVDRVEVLADGGSAIYGSDAVAGIVNVILREPYDVIQTTIQTGLKDGSTDWQARQTLGTTWDKSGSGIGNGGITITYQHTYTDPIDAADRPNLYDDDLTPYIGATGAQPVYASPGNARGFAGAGGAATLYAVPAGIGATQAVNLSQLGPSGQPNRESIWLKAFPLPRITRDTVAGVFKQDLTNWLSFSFFGAYMRRSGAATYGTQPTVSSAINVPDTNPYSPCRAGAPADTAHTPALMCPAGEIDVLYAWTREFGTTTHRDFFQTQHDMTGTFDIDLPYTWHAKISGFLGKDYGEGTTDPRVNSTALKQVVSGVGKPSSVPYFNPFCDNTAGPCNSPITDQYVSAYVKGTNTNWLNDYNIDLDGPLFDLPGGTVRLALGGEWSRQSLVVARYATTSAALGVVVPNPPSHDHQTIRSVYGELYLPVIGNANAMPGLQKLELTLAGRITDYTSFGTTRDPKIGINWNPVLDLKVHASWGTSFKAPNLRENDPYAGATMYVVNNISCGQLNGINMAACPLGAANPLTLYSTTGGNSGLTPETARTWTAGADWTPADIPGLYLSATYYNLSNKNRLTQATREAGDIGVVNAGYYDQYVRFNPTFFPTRAVNNQPFTLLDGTTVPTATQTEYDAFLTAIRNEPIYTSVTTPAANPVAYFYDGRNINSGVLKTDGIDYQARYDFDTAWGEAHVGINGSYTLSFKTTAVSTAPVKDVRNSFGYNQDFRVRGEAGIAFDGVSVTAYINHVGGYSVDPSYLPTAAGPQYQHVDSYTTADLSIVYNTGDEGGVPLLRNLELAAIVTNVFDTDPPFMLNAPGTNPVLFDPNVGSAIGRLITLRLTKNW